MIEQNSEIRIDRHYRSGDSTWCPYQGAIHHADDSRADKHGERIQLSDTLEAGLQDGDDVEIIVRTTGRTLTTRWELLSPHTDGPTEAPKSAGCLTCRALAAVPESGT